MRCMRLKSQEETVFISFVLHEYPVHSGTFFVEMNFFECRMSNE